MDIGGMMEAVAYTIVGIGLYLLSDWILNRMEAAAGRRFEKRSLIFFGLLLVLALGSFALIRQLTGAG